MVDDDTSMIRFAIESPVSDRVDSRKTTIRGWCFDISGDPLKGIRARVGDRTYKARRKQARPQVGRIFPDAAESGRSGFLVEVELPRGGGEVVMECRTADGKWHRFERRIFKAPRIEWPWRRKTSQEDLYQLWIERYDRIDQPERDQMLRRIEAMPNPPLISVVVPVYNTPENWLRRMIDSVREQIYPHWELCIADDASPEPHVRGVLEELAAVDPRIKAAYRTENGHISAASNSAIELTTGDFMALLDHDDELPPHALYWMAEEILAHPEVDVFFSDEDKIDTKGRRFDPYFKPDFNYDLLLAQNCISHLGVYRLTKVREAGGFRIGMEGSQDWDLFFRVLEISDESKIRHIPRVLYHWRQIPGSTSVSGDEKPYAAKAARRAVEQHLERIGRRVEEVGHAGDFVRVVWPLPEPPPPVTLIMPTRNLLPLLRVAVETILEKTDYRDFELLIVDNESDDPQTIEFLREIVVRDSRVRVLPVAGEFNYSRLNNLAVAATDRPFIGLVNNDLEVISGDWLRELVSQAARPEIGAVGAKLIYPDGRLQHAGVVIGMVSGAGHPFRGDANAELTHGARAALAQRYSALTAACLVVERSLFEKVGGLDEGEFRIGLNDVDFCLKLRELGYHNLYTPFAELIHHESASRADLEKTPEGADRAARENAALAKKWPSFFDHDPCWTPNLSLQSETTELAFPPNRGKVAES
ncbi:MAG: glycosyltransferase family 2 protein [Verrucomicrobiae bacterium]|nr:glycosyltransferase family 2 protein [Verrucomicrobiae bacterium]